MFCQGLSRGVRFSWTTGLEMEPARSVFQSGGCGSAGLKWTFWGIWGDPQPRTHPVSGADTARWKDCLLQPAGGSMGRKIKGCPG